MKKSNLLNLFTLMLFLSFSVIYTSCTSEDKCDSLECGTGNCEDGACVCVGNFTGTNCELCIDGYEGTDCETETRAKFYGDYDIVKGNCTGDDFPLFETMVVSENLDSIHLVDINLSSPGTSSSLNGSIRNDSLIVTLESFSNIYIRGAYTSNGDLTGTYRRLATSGDGTCEVVYKRK